MTPLSAAQTRLVESCIAKVARLAKQLSPRMPHASIEELRSAGYEGLVQAALRYDPACGVPFAAFAHYRVRGAMIDAARRAAPEIRRRSRAMRALHATQALLEHAEHSRASPEVGDPRTLRERVAAAAELVAQTTAAVLLTKIAPEDPEEVGDPDADIEAQLAQAEVIAALRKAVAGCNPEERALIDALYVQGLTMHEYGEQLGKNVSTISRHHAKVIARLTRELGTLRSPRAPLGPGTLHEPPRAPAPPVPTARGPPDS
jgi:RNA polymerase sigma factor for flagellar operon FliA